MMSEVESSENTCMNLVVRVQNSRLSTKEFEQQPKFLQRFFQILIEVRQRQSYLWERRLMHLNFTSNLTHAENVY